MTTKYYLISTKYKHYIPGTVFKHDGNKIYVNLSKNDFKFTDKIPKDWIEISKGESEYLIKKDVSIRIILKENAIFDRISNLQMNDECIYIRDKLKYRCRIKQLVWNGDQLTFRVITEKGSPLLVPAVDIELIIGDTCTLPTVDTTLEDKGLQGNQISSAFDNATNRDSNDKIKLVRCKITKMIIVEENCIKSVEKSVSYDKILVLKYENISCVVTLKWKGLVNKKPCIGIVLSKDCEYGTNGTFKKHNLFECSGQKGVLVMLDDSIKCCEGEVRGASAGGSEHNAIILTLKKTIADNCICCVEGASKVGSLDFIKVDKRIMVRDAVYGTIKWIGFINGIECIGMEMDNYYDGTNGTFHEIKLFECKSKGGVLYKTEDFSRTFVCADLSLNILNPTCLESIKNFRRLSKYIVHRSPNTCRTLNVRWIGQINGQLCVGCALTSYYRNGTNGSFMDTKLFECDNHTGVLVPAQQLSDKCFSETSHDDVKSAEDFSPINEDSICCMETVNINDNMRIGQLMIIDICEKRRLVKCFWTGKINGTDSAGLVMDSEEDHGTNGTFCGIKLFECKQGFGVLYRLRQINYVPKIEFLKEIYLRKDYYLKAVEQDRSDSAVGKLFRVKEMPLVRGHFRFSIQLFDEKLLVLEIDEGSVQTYTEELKDVLYVDDIIPGKTAVIVKYNSAEIVVEDLTYFPDSFVVDFKSVRQEEVHQSVEFHNNDQVEFKIENTNHFGLVLGSQLLNNIKCVNVWDINMNKTLYIREDALTKVLQNSIILKPKGDVVDDNRRELDSTVDEIKNIELPAQQMTPNEEVVSELEVSPATVSAEVAIASPELTTMIPDNDYFKNTFLNKDIDLWTVDRTDICAVKDRVVRVIDYPAVNGKALFVTYFKNEPLVAIEIEKTEIQRNKHMLKDIKIFDNGKGDKTVALVRLNQTDFHYDFLKHVNESDVIDIASVKERQEYQSSVFEVDDIVRFRNNNIKCFGRVVEFIQLNGTPCVGLMETIELRGGYNILYVKEDPSNIFRVNESTIKYFDETIIDPNSIVTFKHSSDDDFAKDDEIWFRLKSITGRIQGFIRLVAEINNVASAIVELNDSSKHRKLEPYELNNFKEFQDVFEFSKAAVIIKISPAIQTKYLIYEAYNLLILNPAYVDEVEEIYTEDKTITFQSKGAVVVVKLLWHGRIDKQLYIGCEMKEQLSWGTNGVFGTHKLFTCAEGKGALIPLDTIPGCCGNGSHAPLGVYNDGTINAVSICCAKTVQQLKNKSNIKLNQRVTVSHGTGTIEGTCRWLGLLNDIEVVGVEAEQYQDGGGNEWLLRMGIYDKIGLLKSEMVTVEDSFYKGIFFKNDIGASQVQRKVDGGKLVYVRGHPGIYGRYISIIELENEALLAIEINPDLLGQHKTSFENIRFYENDNGLLTVIIVKRGSVTEFKEPLRYLNASQIIDIHSVKVKEHCEPLRLKKDDIVTYDNENEKCCGRIVGFELLNDVRCVGIKNSIEVPGDDKVVYVKEDIVTLVEVDQGMTKYFEDTIVDPGSIVTLTQSSDEDLNDNDDVQFTLMESKKRLEGRIRLIVEANGVISAIVELNSSFFNEEFSKLKINENPRYKHILHFSKTALIVRGSALRKKFIFCAKNKVPILNPANVDVVTEARNEDKIIRFKSGEFTIVSKLCWWGRINHQLYIGCEMREESMYGTDGTFARVRLFHCRQSRGVLIPMDQIDYCCAKGTHRALIFTDRRIMGEFICCVEQKKLNDQINFEVKDKIVNDKGTKGVCRWIGLVNGEEVVALESDHLQGNWYDADIATLDMFNDPSKSIALFRSDTFNLAEPIEFFKDIFLKSEIDLTGANKRTGQNKLVVVKEGQWICGRDMFTVALRHEELTAINVAQDIITRHPHLLDGVKMYRNDVGAEEFILVRSSTVLEFDEPLKCIGGSNIIDMDSVKVKEHCEPQELKKDDIVSYDKGYKKCYGRVMALGLLNDVRCVGIKNSIEVPGDDKLVYVKEDIVTLVKVDQAMTRYFEDTIVDPGSIGTLSQSSDEDLKVGDEVEMTLKKTRKKLEGRVRLIVEVNGVISAIVELSENSGNIIDVSKYSISDKEIFKNICQSPKHTIIVRGSPTTRAKYLFCETNQVTILNPAYVDCVEDFNPEEMVITFKSKGEAIVAKLLWRGHINDQLYIGCEMREESMYGTNGIFGGSKFFDCPENKGVLIPLDKIEDCCVNGTHKELKKLDDGRIVGSSVCCAKAMQQLKDRFDIWPGLKVIKIKGTSHMHVMCRWIGLVNGSEVLALETENRHDEWWDECLDRFSLFDNSQKRIYLFVPSEFYPDDDVNFYKNIFFKQEVDKTSIIRSADVGRLVYVEGHPGTFGRILYKVLWKKVVLVVIQINANYLRTNNEIFRLIKMYPNESGDLSVIMANTRYVKEFKGDIKYIEGSKVIDMNSIKVKEFYESKIIKKNDIVTYDNGRRKCFGKIMTFELLNDVRCVGIKNSIEVPGDDKVVYVKEDAVTQITVDDTMTEYVEDIIVDPGSIVTLTQSNHVDLKINDEVVFTLALTGTRLEGIIRLIADVNGVPHVFIELSVNVNEEYTKHCLNTIPLFQDAFRFTKPVVIVKGDPFVIRKKYLFCEKNNVLILNPINVDLVEESIIENRIVTFKSLGNNIVAKLLWRGRIRNQLYIGCEMGVESIYGTEGTFAKIKLFDCSEDKGVLIPLDKIEDCCVYGTHRPLVISDDGRIVASSVCCCTKKLSELERKPDIKFGKPLKTLNIRCRIFGSCVWMGLVNDKEAIGVEMARCYDNRDDDLRRILTHIQYPGNNMVLFTPEEFTIDYVGLGYCFKKDLCFIKTNNIIDVEDGEMVNKQMKYKVDDKESIINVRWCGKINDDMFVGCELDYECECEGQGVYHQDIEFKCDPGKGLLVPVSRLFGSCEYQNQLNHINLRSGYDYHTKITFGIHGSINTDSICCVEPLGVIVGQPSLKIGSKLVFASDAPCDKPIGDCEWLGLINGIESIGANMDEVVNNVQTCPFKIFPDNEGRAVLFKLADIIHDIEGEKLPFLVSQIVNVKDLWKVKTNDVIDTEGRNIGDYVQMKLTVGDEYRSLMGELKWIGTINNIPCFGIDLEEECDYGMSGQDKGEDLFVYPPRHGVVTTMDNVEKFEVNVSYIDVGVVDSSKYLKCEEKWDEEQLRNIGVEKDGVMFVIINNDDGKFKRKGILRWSGTMNGVDLAVAELSADYEYGTDGHFWRERLIECPNKRAVAVPWNCVHKYIPYTQMDIPVDKRLFEEISINSAVLYYIAQNDTLRNFYGTVKWSGIDEFDDYLYGIELDDRSIEGTDGRFKDQQLFRCQNKFGVLVPIDSVAPDIRFNLSAVTDEDIPQSKDSDVYQYALPTKQKLGENCGIQGNANSCYFDSSIFALFSKSDVLDFMISPLVNARETNDTTKEFRDIMTYKIVWPLRQFGTVSFHKTRDMRAVIKNFGAKFEEMTKHETDMENVAALLSKLSPEEQLLRLTTFANPDNMFKNACMFLQLFMTLDTRMPYITSQQMLEISMAQNEIMFDEAPTCLIMQAPRDARGINCYENVLPSKTMEISKLCLRSFKKCSKCDKTAEWQCRKCLERLLNICDSQYCDEHKCEDEEKGHIPDSSMESQSQVQLHLKAIICIERAHFVSYVKEDEFQENWIFFDSMSTQNNANNYSVPKVSSEKAVSNFLSKDEATMEESLREYVPADLKRIVKDSYIFVYHNSAKTCY